MQNVIVSYPRSGNHLLRFIVEYITARPTEGCSKQDLPVFTNTYPEKDLMKHVVKNDSFVLTKYHTFPHEEKCKSVICLVRDYRECITKFVQYSTDIKKLKVEIERYFNILWTWSTFDGPKLLIKYENLVENPCKEIYAIVGFILLNDNSFSESDLKLVHSRLDYFVKNYKELFHECAMAKKRHWGGFNSKMKTKFHILRQPFSNRMMFEMLCQNFMDKQSLEYQQQVGEIVREYNPMCVDLLMSPSGGICNRLRSFILQQLYNKHEASKSYCLPLRLIVVWKQTSACQQPFSQLFLQKKNGESIFPNVTFCEDEFDYDEIHIDLEINDTVDKSQKIEEMKDLFSKITPTDRIQKRIHAVVQGIHEPFIAIHVRRTDHISLAKEKNKFTTDTTFFDFIDQHSKECPIFLATDNENTQAIFKKRYNDRLHWNTKIAQRKDLRQTSEENAVVDLFVCAHARYFLGSGYSSFTDTIQLLRKIRKESKLSQTISI